MIFNRHEGSFGLTNIALFVPGIIMVFIVAGWKWGLVSLVIYWVLVVFVLMPIVSKRFFAFGLDRKLEAQPVVQATQTTSIADLEATALELAVGKTEAQFRSAASLHPKLRGSPILSLIRAGLFSQALIANGKIVLGQDGKYEKLNSKGGE